jgi:hypothetical protein
MPSWYQILSQWTIFVNNSIKKIKKGQKNSAGKLIRASFFNHYKSGGLGNLHAGVQPKSGHFKILDAQYWPTEVKLKIVVPEFDLENLKLPICLWTPINFLSHYP